jgi:serine/threonine-protein kinase PknK
VLGLPGFRDVVLIGQGGFSSVYRAYQERFDRPVAVKVLTINPSDVAALSRFKRECELTGRLTGHPNIVHVLDSGTTSAGQPFLLMDFFERGSLADRVRAEGPLAVEEVLKLGVKLSGAIETAHQAGVLHRDVKPENVLQSRYEPALADFGIAGLIANGGVTISPRGFTPVHAPPEVLDGHPATPASDIYSLGSTLYAALAGRPAFQSVEGEPLLAVQVRVLRDDPPPIGRGDVPFQVEEALHVAMAKDPRLRPGSAAVFGERLRDLQGLLGHPKTDLVVAHVPASGQASELHAPLPSALASAAAVDQAPAQPPGWNPAPDPVEARDPAPTVLRGAPSSGPRQGLPIPPGAVPPASGREQNGPRTPTVVVPGHSPPADPADEQPHSRGVPRRVRIAAIAGACLAIAAALVVFLGGRAGSGSKPVAHPSTATDANDTPKDLTVTRSSPTEVTLSWNPGDGANLSHSITWGSAGETSVTAVDPGASSDVLTAPAGTIYCFKVGALVSVGEPSVMAWSPQQCTSDG